MPVAAEAYSAGACVRGDLHGVIDASSRGTSFPGLDLYDLGIDVDMNDFRHLVVGAFICHIAYLLLCLKKLEPKSYMNNVHAHTLCSTGKKSNTEIYTEGCP